MPPQNKKDNLGGAQKMLSNTKFFKHFLTFLFFRCCWCSKKAKTAPRWLQDAPSLQISLLLGVHMTQLGLNFAPTWPQEGLKSASRCLRALSRSSRGPSGSDLSFLEFFRVRRAVRALLEPSGSLLERSLSRLETSWNGLEAILGPPWGHFWPFCLSFSNVF